MFPIRDHNPSERTPYVTYALMAINIAVFISYWGILNNPVEVSRFFLNWALTPYLVSDGEMIYTLVTSMFLHGGVVHLAGNMLFLWIFGDNMEDELGHIGYLAFYTTCGIGAGVAQVLADTASPVPMVGASGAIAGVMGGYLLLFPKAKVDILLVFIIFFKIFPVRAWVMLCLWFALQLLSGAAIDTEAGGIAYWAHAGGFTIGLMLIVPFWLRQGGTDFWRKTEGHPPHPEARYRFSPSSIPKVRKRR